jgi:hypothetical protein
MFRKNTQFEILTPTGWQDFDGIQHLKKPTALKIIFENNEEIICSLDHKFLTKQGFKEANIFVVGDEITGLKIISIEKVTNQELYDPINVAEHNSYNSGSVVSHNCEFLGSSNTLIDAAYLRKMVWQKPLMRTDEGFDMLVEPIENHNYAIVCDTSRGQELDYSAFVVIDISEMPYKTVAKYRSNTISPLLYPQIIFNAGKNYNNAMVLVEINDNGQQVASILAEDLEYENVINVAKDPKAGQVITGGFIPYGSEMRLQQGVKTSKQVKRLGCALLKNLVETNKLEVNDIDIIGELSTFVLTKDTYMAEEGCHDDTAMCLVLFAWMANQEYFKTLTNTTMRESLYKVRMQQIDDEMLPPGYMVNGGNNEDVGLALKVGLGQDAWLVGVDDDSMSLARSGNNNSNRKPHANRLLYLDD